MFDSLAAHEQRSLVGYSPWNSPGKNTGVGCHALLQGIFLAQGLNLGLLHCRQILYHLSHLKLWIVILYICKLYNIVPQLCLSFKKWEKKKNIHSFIHSLIEYLFPEHLPRTSTWGRCSVGGLWAEEGSAQAPGPAPGSESMKANGGGGWGRVRRAGVSLHACVPIRHCQGSRLSAVWFLCFSIQAKVGGHLLKWAQRKHFHCAENWLLRRGCVLSTEPVCRGDAGSSGQGWGAGREALLLWSHSGLERCPCSCPILVRAQAQIVSVSKASNPFLKLRGLCMGFA